MAEIAEYYIEEHVHTIEQFDLIVINKRLIVLNVRELSCYPNYPRGIYWKETGEDTLEEF